MEYLTDRQCRQLKKYWDSQKIEKRIKLLDAARAIESDQKFTREDVVAISRIMVLMMDGGLSTVLEEEPFQEKEPPRKQNTLAATMTDVLHHKEEGKR